MYVFSLGRQKTRSAFALIESTNGVHALAVLFDDQNSIIIGNYINCLSSVHYPIGADTSLLPVRLSHTGQPFSASVFVPHSLMKLTMAKCARPSGTLAVQQQYTALDAIWHGIYYYFLDAAVISSPDRVILYVRE